MWWARSRRQAQVCLSGTAARWAGPDGAVMTFSCADLRQVLDGVQRLAREQRIGTLSVWLAGTLVRVGLLTVPLGVRNMPEANAAATAALRAAKGAAPTEVVRLSGVDTPGRASLAAIVDESVLLAFGPGAKLPYRISSIKPWWSGVAVLGASRRGDVQRVEQARVVGFYDGQSLSIVESDADATTHAATHEASSDDEAQRLVLRRCVARGVAPRACVRLLDTSSATVPKDAGFAFASDLAIGEAF
ncbi:MAG: hypothetical protein E6Q93_04030 [Burkholderiaceae bacterium]|nr:MAG: hypothetical protein E6Q93_04030 [Burkholderiaceae bacterium]